MNGGTNKHAREQAKWKTSDKWMGGPQQDGVWPEGRTDGCLVGYSISLHCCYIAASIHSSRSHLNWVKVVGSQTNE